MSTNLESTTTPSAAAAATTEPAYYFIHVDVSAEQSEDVGVLLFDLGAQGVEERDSTTLLSNESTAPVTLVASFLDHEAATEALAGLDPAWSPRIEQVVGDEWRDAWKEHFRPFLLSPRVIVCPPWEPTPSPSPEVYVLELEPGRAFGTGLHPTTSLVAGVLDTYSAHYQGITLLDVGTGSGILSLTALLLGAKDVVAIDNDPEAIEVALENAARNELGDRLSASTTPLANVSGGSSFIVANIETRVLIPMAGTLQAKLAPQGWLILSGILVSQEDEIRAAFSPPLAITEIQRSGDWSCFVMRN